MPTLADIYSFIDTQKRKAGNLLRSPVSTLQEMAALSNDEARQINQETALASQGRRKQMIGKQPTEEQAAAQKSLIDRLTDSALSGMTVWHGSPYKFTKFDAKKIGAGEGAQAYGHGLYVAENPNVAGEYKDKLNFRNFAKIVEKSRNNYDVIAPDGTVLAEGVLHGAARKAKDVFDNDQKGNLYKIDLPDEHIAKMLDWDKPLVEQPQSVKDALSALPHRGPDWTFKDTLETLEAAPHLKNDTSLNPTGDQIYSMFGKGFMVGNSAQGQAEASKTLADIGIPGIRYLDQKSRDLNKNWVVNIKDYGGYDFPSLKEAKEFMKSNPQYKMDLIEPPKATSNFVIFPNNEHLLDIQEINSKALK